MKTSIKLALVIFGAAGVAMPLAAFADDATPEGGNNCSNMRTTTHSRCVHYNEKAHDGWANQQAQKAGAGSQAKNSYVPKPFPTNLPPLDALKRAAADAASGEHGYVNWGGSFGSGPSIGGTSAAQGGSGGKRSSR